VSVREKTEILVIKQNHLGQEVWRYPGTVLQAAQGRITLEAFFNRDDLPFNGIVLRRNDRFIETYYSRRWYNIYEIHDRDDEHLKAWYCNICRPAKFENNVIRFDDLALDLLIYPDRSTLLLDEDEFEVLELDEKTRQACWRAVDKLKALAAVIRPYKRPR